MAEVSTEVIAKIGEGGVAHRLTRKATEPWAEVERRSELPSQSSLQTLNVEDVVAPCAWVAPPTRPLALDHGHRP